MKEKKNDSEAESAILSPWFRDGIAVLIAGNELSDAQVRSALRPMLLGDFRETEAGAFLVSWRIKGETAVELASAARVLREHMIRWDAGAVLDTCGTGGDGLCTFNISTAAALVVAAVGVPVVKHGNRGASSTSGSADVLAVLGVRPEADVAAARRCLAECGLAFCFAPAFHPGLRHVAPLRRRLGTATLFNWLGPLANPAGACHQLLGVGKMELLDRMAGALAELGTRKALVVCSQDGLDEVSLSAPTAVREVVGKKIKAYEWTPTDFELAPVGLAELVVDGPQASAMIIRAVLSGQEGPATRVVIANSAAALLAAEKVSTLPEGVRLAREALSSGRAKKVLEALADQHGR
jgi:anthranilate phosphoribosyltransferase